MDDTARNMPFLTYIKQLALFQESFLSCPQQTQQIRTERMRTERIKASFVQRDKISCDRIFLNGDHVRQLTEAVLLAFVVFFGTSLPARAQPLASVKQSPQTASVPSQINQIRLSANLPPLTAHPLLQQAAQMHALDMITYGNWSHIGTDGSRVGDRVNRTGYLVDGWTSENWVSAVNATSALKWWMNSPIHRNNILGSHWQEFGVGSVVDPTSGRTIYVAVFTTGAHTNGRSVPLLRQPVAAQPVVTQPAVTQSNNVSSNLASGGASSRSATLTIQPGDTLFGLAEQLGVPWAEIASLNNWSEGTILQVGEAFLVPTVAYARNNSDEPNSQSSSQSSSQSTSRSTSQLSGQSDSTTAQPRFIPARKVDSDEVYVVKPGDTLIGVAERFQIDWQVIAHVNNLVAPDMLQIGEQLVLPSILASSKPSAQPHVVEAGDTIISIAGQYGLEWGALLRLNGLSESTILQIGQELRVTNDGDF